MTSPNGRTHEPSLREITADLDGFKALVEAQFDALRDVMAERDRRYDQQFKSGETAVTAALAAQKELTSAAFASSEKAIVKAEEAQRSYNASHNDLIRKMDSMIPRTEFDARLVGIDKDVSSLRESRSAGSGREAQSHYLIGLAIAIGLPLAGLVVGLVLKFVK